MMYSFSFIKTFVRDFIYVFCNYFVSNIPIWWLRKLIFILLGMKIGKGSRICMKCTIMSPWKISIGKNTMVNEYVLLDGRGGLFIGDDCAISMGAIIYTASHYVNSSTFQYYSKKTEIMNCCWLGARCIILPGSRLDNKTVIGANSVFKGISKENDILVGNPANVIRKRNVHYTYHQNILNYFK